jgi:hypothetical protein
LPLLVMGAVGASDTRASARVIPSAAIRSSTGRACQLAGIEPKTYCYKSTPRSVQNTAVASEELKRAMGALRALPI